MPSIKNIDKFVQLLNSLGDEPQLLEKRGQEIEPAVVPDKTPVEANPFLANLDDTDTPDLTAGLDLFDDDDLLADDDDLDIGAPDLEIDDDFSLDDVDVSDNTEVVPADTFNLDGLDDLGNTDVEPDNSLDIESLDDLGNIEPEIPLDIDTLDDLGITDAEPDVSLDLDDIGSTETEPEDSFDLDALDDIAVDETESLDIDTLDDLDMTETTDTEPDDSFDLDGLDDLGTSDSESLDIDSLEDLDIAETDSEDSFDLDGLDDLETTDTVSDDFLDLDGLDEVDDTATGSDEPLNLDDISNSDTDEPFELEELGELSDEDLDTSPESLSDDGIKEIDIDDIGMEEETTDTMDFDELSIEDEVLEDDFGALEDDDSDEFSLGDFGDSFNFDKEDSSSSIVLEEFSDDAPEVEEETQEKQYTQEEFDNIKKALVGLPLNVKIVIEEEIAENGLFGSKLDGLVDLLIEDATLKEIVKYLNKKLGHKIKISSSFAKLTATDFEKKKLTFSYILLNTVLPKLKWIFPITIVLALLYLAGYFWGYKILKSEQIYKNGHELILIDKYEEAYDEFLLAFNTHRKTKWYHIYADTYHQRKAFGFAEIIYLQILNENSTDLGTILAYAQMKGFDEGEYEKATNFLIGYIDRGYRNYDIMETLADLYMQWSKVDPARYEDARLWYAETMTTHGPKPRVLFKFLNYFIATDNLKEVQAYRRMFEISESVKVEGDSYARMAGYLMDKDIVENVRETLFRGIKDDPRNPNLHYQLARYFKSIDNDREVEKAARNAIFYYEYGGHLTAEELAYLVDSKRLLGLLYSKEERYLAAEQNFQGAVSLYENLRDRNFVETDEKFGAIYADYGDIFYYAGNSYSSAYNLYNKAEENMYNTPELSYKKGFINYQQDNLKDALFEFHEAEDIRVSRESILFAKANTLSKRGSYSSALTYYNMHLRYLKKQEDEHEVLYPEENEAHLAIIENTIRVYNNMGVTLYKLYGEKALPEVGMAFTKSTEKYDYLTRDPDFLIRSGLKDLAYYNTKAILYPDKEMELMLYNSISKDFKDLNLGIVSSLNQE
ncbi:MAG: hypothetical protein OCD02_02460 [Spirochaetaceae bacterium]